MHAEFESEWYFSIVLPQGLAGGILHPFCRRGQKLGSSERDYMYVLQITQVSLHFTPSPTLI
jgi:hypothetical protein